MTGLNADQIEKLMSDPEIQATIEANKARAAKNRGAELMLIGYNQALLDCGQAALPEGWTLVQMQDVINGQRAKLGI